MFLPRVRAPNLAGIKAWINSKPLELPALKGKVVLIDFWTFSCINCMRTLPYLKKWHDKYSEKGLVIIGVASPEFEFEGEPKNVKEAVKKLGIEYPVAVDSDMKSWQAYDNHYWPAKYLIDRDGFIAYVHFGEGSYNETESAIQKELGLKSRLEKEQFPGYLFDQSPETYAGFGRNFGLGSGLVCDKTGCNVYVDPGDHVPNVVYPHGEWVQEKEYIELKRDIGVISYRFNAREVNLVMEPVGKPVDAEIYINEKKAGEVKVDSAIMYNVYKDKKYGDRELKVVFKGKVRVYAFTFG
ncbi:MAG TPA: redoxin family protein [Candidatus Bilamarchaeum sp.]|nr:redoxin family protein [Candidatus Bilamarchaeum sp.]